MLKVEDVHCGYNGAEVLKGITFHMKKSEKLCVIGPNGCGKTTLLRAIAGLIKCDGDIYLLGTLQSKMKRSEIASKIAILRQSEALYFSYTIYDTVMLGRYLHQKKGIFGGPSKYDRDYVMHCIETVGLQKLESRQITTLSGGELQRVFLAKALAQEPNLILLDEPTNHLDLKFQVELVEYLKKWSKKEGRGVIGVLHDINLAMHFADKILLLSNGSMVAYGDMEKFTDGNLLADVYHMDIKGHMAKSLKMWEV